MTTLKNIISSIALVSVTSSCGTSPPTRLFLPQIEPSNQSTAAAALVLGLRTVELPEYLNNDHMPYFASGSELRHGEYERWAEPFKDVLGGLLVSSLRNAGIGDVVAEPWPDFFKPSCAVWLRLNDWVVVRDRIEARFSWAITAASRGEPEIRSVKISERKSGTGPDAYAATTAAIVARLSTEVGGVVKSSNSCQAQYIDKK